MTNLMRRNLWSPGQLLSEMMDRPLRSLLDETLSYGTGFAVDVTETDNGYLVQTELPGVQLEDIDVRMEDSVLTINGEIPVDEEQEENARYLMRERRYGRFSRSIRLPQTVDADGIEATYNDGILELRIPKLPEKQPKRIQVKSGKGGKLLGS